MKTRHRMPTVFSIYMVDVLCCALGCVILLWLVSFRDAKQRATLASETNQRLTESQSALDTSTSELAGLRGALSDSQKREQTVRLLLKTVQAERDKARQLALLARKDEAATKLALLRSDKDLANLRLDFKNLEAKSAQTSANLAALTAEQARVLKKMTVAELRVRSLEKDLTAKRSLIQEADAASRKLTEQLADLRLLARGYRDKLSVAEIRARLLEEDLSRGKKDLLISQKRLQELLLSQDILSRRLALFTKDLKTATASIASLKEEKISLINRARLIQEAVEHRFAGITLTGQNVLFLVDMSGSMELLDEATPDPDKWPEVCETVAKIMRSLPDLKRYQVVLFSDRVRYPFGKEGRWLEYSPRVTPKATFDGLKATKPKGETNMMAVFEEAFRFRNSGLDTIYVLSDGLPNAGPGLPTAATNLSDTQKTEYLSKYVRNRLKYVLNRPPRRVRINTIGFFFESPDVGAFLWALAREHDGSFVGMSK